MLTKNDLHQIDSLLDKKLDEKLKTIHGDIKTIKKDVGKIKKDLDGHINLTDKWILYHNKRIRKVENKLAIETPEFAGS